MKDSFTGITFKAILFDVDDTLFDRRALFASWAEQYITDILQITDQARRAEIVETLSQLEGDGFGSKKELIEKVLTTFPPTTDSRYNAATAFSEYESSNVLDADALRLMDRLEQIKMPYGIVTNGSARQVEKVKKLGLGERVPCLFVSETFGSAKPDSAIFLAAAKCVGALASEILFVGDHPVNDIYGAYNAGMLTAWLPNGQPWPTNLGSLRPNIVLERLSDLFDILPEKN